MTTREIKELADNTEMEVSAEPARMQEAIQSLAKAVSELAEKVSELQATVNEFHGRAMD